MNSLNKMRITDIALSKLDTAYQAGKGGKDAFKKYAGQECIMDFADGLVEAVIQAYLKDIWKPISEAPKDGTMIIVDDGTAYWSSSHASWFSHQSQSPIEWEVTHYCDPDDIIPEERT